MGKGGQSKATNATGVTSASAPFDDFYRADGDEPHATRRRAILKAHPEISTLFEPDMRPIPVVVFLVLSQLTIAYYSQYFSWPLYLAVCYIYGGTATHSLSLMAHELSHNLVFKRKKANELFAIFTTLGSFLPSAVTFKRYHMEHHQFQGREGIDVDVPTYFEGWFVSNNRLLKFLFLCIMPIVYGIRPVIIRPKDMNFMESVNFVVCIAAVLTLFHCSGWAGVVYPPLSLLLGHSLHPMAGHFIAEHYVFIEGQETYSYYGPLNWFAWNVGYHNEHHDFPRVPGWKLPQVKAMAPEFYDSLPCYHSWTAVLYNFVMDPRITPFSRVVRSADRSELKTAKAVDIDAATFGPEVAAGTDCMDMTRRRETQPSETQPTITTRSASKRKKET